MADSPVKINQTERLLQRAEVEEVYHDRWAQELHVDELLVRELFEAPTSLDNEFILKTIGDLGGKRVLDMACGVGEAAVYFAQRGAVASAMDISQGMVSLAEQLAKKYGVSVDARKMRAEALEYEDNTFDVIYGYGALHHIDLEHGSDEIYRVLKKGGLAIFSEPLAYNPGLWVYRILAKETRTETEKPFTFSDLRFFKEFRRVQHREFWLLAMLIYLDFFFIKRYNPSKVRYWRQVLVEGEKYRRLIGVLKRIDGFLLRYVPPLRYLSSTSVIILRK
jgi:SAM-dependent methyltransferase